MGEMAWEPVPAAPNVRVTPRWPRRVFDWWCRAFYGHKRGWIILGWWIVPVLVFVTLKVAVFWAGLALLSTLWLFSALWGVVTYPHRKKRSEIDTILPWVLELHDQSPPDVA